jgi:hypothetical protein
MTRSSAATAMLRILPQSEDPAHRAERTSWGVRPGRVSDHDPAVADHRTDV